MKNTDHHKAFLHNENVLVVFTGHHTYVSATWYSNPNWASTWNYMSVHVKGLIRFLDEAALEDVLRKTSLHFENYDYQSSAIEAANLFFEDERIEIKPHNINLEVDLKQFFTYYRVINAKFLAKRIGMNESLLSQYVQGRKKPSKKQTERILAGIHEIGKELSDINLI